jgi:hypothetical protein
MIFFFKFITNTNKFNYQLLQLHTLIMHFDPFGIVYCYISEERDALLNENDNWITSDSELI